MHRSGEWHKAAARRRAGSRVLCHPLQVMGKEGAADRLCGGFGGRSSKCVNPALFKEKLTEMDALGFSVQRSNPVPASCP